MLHFQRLMDFVLMALATLLAITVHEFAHGFVSDKLGDPTPRNSGRLSLNPLKHLDPMGTICLLFFHMGWANPVPINPGYYRNPRKGVMLVSLAGPLANGVLAFLSLLLEGFLVRFHGSYFLISFFEYLAILNVGLGLFNLIPIPPLDGSKVLGSFFRAAERFYDRYDRYWSLILFLCILTGILRLPLAQLNNIVLNALARIVQILI